MPRTFVIIHTLHARGVGTLQYRAPRMMAHRAIDPPSPYTVSKLEPLTIHIHEAIAQCEVGVGEGLMHMELRH